MATISAPRWTCSRMIAASPGLERAGLREDRVRDADLADVVEERGGRERPELRRRRRELAPDRERDPPHALRVARRVRVARLDRGVQRLDRVEEVLLHLARATRSAHAIASARAVVLPREPRGRAAHEQRPGRARGSRTRRATAIHTVRVALRDARVEDVRAEEDLHDADRTAAWRGQRRPDDDRALARATRHGAARSRSRSRSTDRLRSTARTCARALTCRRPGIVETTGLPVRRPDRDARELGGSAHGAREAARARRPRDRSGFRARARERAPSSRTGPTSRARSSSTCSRRLCASSDDSTSAPAARIAADASTKVQSRRQRPDETGRAVRAGRHVACYRPRPAADEET